MSEDQPADQGIGSLHLDGPPGGGTPDTSRPRRISAQTFAAALAALGTLPVAQAAGYPESATESDLQQELRFLQSEASAEKFITTATRTRELIQKSGATVNLVTADQLLQLGARDVTDALRLIPGFGVTRNFGGLPEVEIRGVKTPSSEKVLFMMDNHAINQNLANGGALWALEGIQINNVKRIEVVRGPGSALYGANAFLGVVNVITKDAADIDGVEATAGGGSFGTQEYNVLYGKQAGQVDVVANFNYLNSDGFQGLVASDAIGQSGHTLRPVERYGGDVKLKYNGFWFRANYAHLTTGPYLGITHVLNDESEQRDEQYFAELGYERKVGEKLTLMVRGYRDFFRFDNYWEIFPEGFGFGAYPDGALVRTAVSNTKHGGELSAKYEISDSNKLIGGVQGDLLQQFDPELEANFNPLTFAPVVPYQDLYDQYPWTQEVSRRDLAVFAEDIWDIVPTLRLIAGARYDNYSDFGNTFNPRGSLVWEFVRDYHAKVSYGSAFRDPTFAELYNRNNSVVTGNPNLDPEKIHTYEMGVGGPIAGNSTFQVIGFYNDIEDLILPTALGVTDNAGSATVKGVEAEVKLAFGDGVFLGSFLGLNYTYQDARDQLTDRRLPDTPAHRGTVMLNFALPERCNLFSSLVLKDSTPRAGGDPRDPVPAHAVMNITFTARDLAHVRGLDFSLSLYNALDTTYYSASLPSTMYSDYPAPGRSIFAMVRYRL